MMLTCLINTPLFIKFQGRNPLHILANFGRPETSVEIFQLFMECMPEYPLNQSDAEGNTGIQKI